MRYDWASVQHRLGVDTDFAIAQDLGCTRQAVTLHRTSLNIASAPRQLVEIPGIGVVPDAEAAAASGLTAHGVYQRRYRLGIPRAPRVCPLQERIVAYLRENGPARTIDMCLALHVIEPVLCNGLRRMKARGLVVKDGLPGSHAPWRLV